MFNKTAYLRFIKSMAKEYACSPELIERTIEDGLEMFARSHRENNPLAIMMAQSFLPTYIVGFQSYIFFNNPLVSSLREPHPPTLPPLQRSNQKGKPVLRLVQ